MGSINHPWSISDKHRARYGDTWADIDFVFAERILNEQFRMDPMNTVIGDIHVCNQQISMAYRDLLAYSKSVRTLVNEANLIGSNTDSYPVQLKHKVVNLTRIELVKLAETFNDAATSAMRGYELGLYL